MAQTVVSALEVRKGVRFFVTEGRPHDQGARLLDLCRSTPNGFNLKKELPDACVVVPDSAVGSLMPEMDMTLMGAMCVTEQGGLVHSTGSLQIATVAAATNVPCHVVCETFKFSHVFPLSTKDLKQPAGSGMIPAVEFVPASLITFVFTEKGIMPPSAVADEMFRNHTIAAAGTSLMNTPTTPSSLGVS
jgi:translation initiation factor eIF-2B subunit alpha